MVVVGVGGRLSWMLGGSGFLEKTVGGSVLTHVPRLQFYGI